MVKEDVMFVNNQIIPAKSATIPAIDQGLLYGWGLFETIRVYNKTTFMLDEHLSRMICSARNFKISVPMNKDEITLKIQEYIKVLEFNDFVLKVILTKGDSNIPNLIFTHRKIPYTNEDYEKGYSAMISTIRRNAYSPLVYMKTLNYMENILARQEAQESNYDEALFLNTELIITEGSISNLFFIKNGKIFTPSQSCGLLPGIVRRLVIEKLSKLAGVEVFQGEYKLNHLLEADEAFITNSVIQIMPLSKVNEVAIGSNLNKGITRSLLEAYKHYVEEHTS